MTSNRLIAILVAAIAGLCVWAIVYKGLMYVLDWVACGPQC